MKQQGLKTEEGLLAVCERQEGNRDSEKGAPTCPLTSMSAYLFSRARTIST